ncbi:GEL complex subunit OPTI-like [Sycon ciliatum]|uniref:GEL complex subunit OPTI-like n=1 Tax=Sycon ciliatum TaxID=27933 RepID=UPI0020AE9B94|eukprot:scpid106395/ scgid34698/ Uncharacterized protein C20orf24 homolog
MASDSQMWKYVFVRRSFSEEDKDDFLDVVYWFRQIIAFVIGIVWGVIPLYGALGLLSFAGFSSLLTFIYISKFQDINEDDFGGIQEILKEGFMTSAATFVALWIIVYTSLHS